MRFSGYLYEDYSLSTNKYRYSEEHAQKSLMLPGDAVKTSSVRNNGSYETINK